MAELQTPKPALRGVVTDLDMDGPTTETSTGFLEKRRAQKGDSSLLLPRGGVLTPSEAQMEVLQDVKVVDIQHGEYEIFNKIGKKTTPAAGTVQAGNIIDALKS
jgi:hypothetical protein